MISRADIVERVQEWGLREDVVEKDYVLGWVLWGISRHPILGRSWVFKGGTCLKKCYLETYRFSEDLDFTVLPGGPLESDETLPLLHSVLSAVGEESGIDFTVGEPRIRLRPGSRSVEGRVYYRGPRQSPTAASIKLDLTADEVVVRPSVLRPIAHPYPDALPEAPGVRCYSFEEVFAEKLRAMGQRGRPRDLYDIVNLYRRQDLRQHAVTIRQVLVEKCAVKNVPVPTLAAVEASPFHAELLSEWANMLAHQLPALPPIADFLGELRLLFAWLEGQTQPAALESFPSRVDEDWKWAPPPTIATWRSGVPLETVRFAAANHLCVELSYQGTTRIVEPYSLRRSRPGALLLHALRADDRQHRSYRVDKIEGVRVTTRPFQPVYRVEFSGAGSLNAPPNNARPATGYSGAGRRSKAAYVIECPACGRRFPRKQQNLTLRPHRDSAGWDCIGRRGFVSS